MGSPPMSGTARPYGRHWSLCKSHYVPARAITLTGRLHLVSRAPLKEARPGRPRDRHIDEAVLKATLAGLDESGYGGLTLEAGGRRAGATKPALYPRRPAPPQLRPSAPRRGPGAAPAPRN